MRSRSARETYFGKLAANSAAWQRGAFTMARARIETPRNAARLAALAEDFQFFGGFLQFVESGESGLLFFDRRLVHDWSN